MIARIKSILHTQFLRFAVCGALAATVNVLARIALSTFLSLNVSIVLSFLIGMTTGFFLMKLFVFQPSGRPIHTQYVRFALINVLALLQVWIVTLEFVRWLLPIMHDDWKAETTAHVIGVLSPVATSFIAHRVFTFS